MHGTTIKMLVKLFILNVLSQIMINIGFVWQDIRSFFLILIFGVKPQSLKLSFQQRSAVGTFLHLERVFILFYFFFKLV